MSCELLPAVETFPSNFTKWRSPQGISSPSLYEEESGIMIQNLNHRNMQQAGTVLCNVAQQWQIFVFLLATSTTSVV
jgi:hypothetical protein